MWWTDWNHDRWGIKAVKFAWLFNPLSSSSIIILTVATPHVNPCMSVSVAVKNNFLCLIINHLHQLQILPWHCSVCSKSRALDDQKLCWRQWQIWSLVSRLRNSWEGRVPTTQVMKKSTQKSYESSLSISWWWYLSIFGWVDKTKVHRLTSTMEMLLGLLLFSKLIIGKNSVVVDTGCMLLALLLIAASWRFKLWKPLWIQQL